MKLKHYATDEIIEVEVVTISTTNETIVEDTEGNLGVVSRNKNGNYQLKGTSFLKID